MKQPMPEGLRYRSEFISVEKEAELVEWIDAQAWDTGYSRRRQFYGGSYGAAEEFREIPAILLDLAGELVRSGLLTVMPDRVLVNEYLPGQGIAAHVDHHPQFGNEVAMVSLLDSYPMRFARADEIYDHWLERRSACVMAGPIRYEWTHEIARRTSDPVGARGRRQRGRRLSITFRKRIPG